MKPVRVIRVALLAAASLLIHVCVACVACGSPPLSEPAPPVELGHGLQSSEPEEPFMPGLDVPFVPTPDRVIDAMLMLTNPRPGELIADLGCGDGRIILTALRRVDGLRGLGVDLDPTRIAQATAAARSQGLEGRVTLLEQNIFETDFSRADVVTLYLLPEINVRLRPTMFDTLRPGTRIASHDFDMDDWPPETLLTFGARRVYFWVIPVALGGLWTVTSPHPELPLATLDLVQGFQFVVGTAGTAGTADTAGTAAPGELWLVGRIDGDELDLVLRPPTGPDHRLRARFVAPDRLEGLLDLAPFSARRETLEPIHQQRLDRDPPPP